MNRSKNRHTQPFKEHRVFNNWNVVARGWYIACRSSRLKRGGVHSMDICGQRVVLFRGDDGRVRALDGYCPHMGTDLGIGSVVGQDIRCFFHHWRYDERGQCVDIPCQEEIPERAKLAAYASCERYGYIWVYPEAEAPAGVVEFDELSGESIVCLSGRAYERSCHHHVTMINGIDAQHLKTVHDIQIDMELSLTEDESRRWIDFALSGEVSEGLARKILGPRYEYRMRYADATIGALTLMKNVKLFGRWAAPELHMIFAYRPIAAGRTHVQPIYMTRRRPGLSGWLLSWLLILAVRCAFAFLRDEDGKIYENMRFNPNLMLPIDTPVGRYISYVERLEPSRWSRTAASFDLSG